VVFFRKKDLDSVVGNSHKRMQPVIKKIALPFSLNPHPTGKLELAFQRWIKLIGAASIEPGIKRKKRGIRLSGIPLGRPPVTVS
jgi:hypothetical protein